LRGGDEPVFYKGGGKKKSKLGKRSTPVLGGREAAPCQNERPKEKRRYREKGR